jgi:beta-glucosidase
MKGTHFDWELDVEKRLDYLVANTDLQTQINQLTNEAPGIPKLGIPFYNYLNDDQHGVGQAPAWATLFPNGAGLGAGWSASTLHAVGTVIGEEARGLHNGFLHSGSGRNPSDPTAGGCNGCGITLYAPNLNLVSR